MGWSGLERAKWECLRREWPGDFVSPLQHTPASLWCIVRLSWPSCHSHMWRLIWESWEGSQLLMSLWCVYTFTSNSANIKIFLIKLQIIRLLGLAFIFNFFKYSRTSIWGCILLYHVLWVRPTEKQRGGALSGRKNPNNHHFSRGRGDFSNAASISVSSIMLMNAKMASWWALSAGVPCESCRKRCGLQRWKAEQHNNQSI